MEVEIELGQNSNGALVLKFERIDGNLLYYKKLLNEIRRKCYAL